MRINKVSPLGHVFLDVWVNGGKTTDKDGFTLRAIDFPEFATLLKPEAIELDPENTPDYVIDHLKHHKLIYI